MNNAATLSNQFVLFGDRDHINQKPLLLFSLETCYANCPDQLALFNWLVQREAREAEAVTGGQMKNKLLPYTRPSRFDATIPLRAWAS